MEKNIPSFQINRRQFIATTAVAAAACVSNPWPCIADSVIPRCRGISLNGNWQATKAGTDEWISAVVPGCIHTDLLAAGKIEDPFYRDNSKNVQWVGETNWIYRRTFQVSAETLRHDRVLLRCEGLDTFAEIKINGQEIGSANNMFRTWEFDVKSVLKTGENTIEVSLNSPMQFINERQKERDLYNGVGGRSWVRKEPCSFGWDWAPTLITSGIWRNISIQTLDQACLKNTIILQDHSVPNQVGLTINVEAQPIQKNSLNADVSVTCNGKTVAAAKIVLAEGKGVASIIVKNPKLWWPNGMGDQPLYTVNVYLLDENGKAVDATSRRIGLRTLKLLEKDDKNPLHFEVNAIPFFAKGANWIPSDSFAQRVTPEKLRRYMADAAAVNMNMLRFWGGGYYEEDALYDACDEMGICVWLDFKFACASYPSFDAGFMDNVRREARDNLRRLAHHPCIAVWCGNNEITYLVRDKWGPNFMSREGYGQMFKDLLGGQVKDLSPQASYVTGSPDCGDVHYWDVWWGDQIFDSYRKLSGFMSEFGFQSYPEPKSVRSFTAEEDRASTFTPIMKWHERADTGNQRIKDMTGNYFRAPKDFDSTLWISQIVQGYGIKIGAEAWRRDMPKSMGCLYWQYNDCWPAVSWSSVDYYGRWKALHYMARHFYAPILVSGLENSESQSVEVFISSDKLEDHHGVVSWEVTDFQGRTLKNGSETIQIPPRTSQKIQTLDLSAQCQSHGAGNLLVWLKLHVNGKIVSGNLVTFVRPKEFNLPDPGIKLAFHKTEEGFMTTLTAVKPALWTWLCSDEMDATYSDNFVHLTPSSPVNIHVRPSRPMSEADFANVVKVHSLFDYT
jgi:beta-mannosidase